MSIFVCAVVWRFLPSHQEVQFLVLNYESTDPVTGRKSGRQVKFPGGMGQVDPVQTLVREMHEETGLTPTVWKEIWKQEVSPDHTKYGFFINVDDCRGGLRVTPLDDNGNQLSPPYWANAQTLGRDIYHTHQAPYMAACSELHVL